ncbi:MAG: OmpA family protein [Chitinophagaceae bacterium]|nr:MAG: OmpA family protein [Chitinophagaceae bacterium]
MRKILAVLLGLTLFTGTVSAQDDDIRPAAIGVSFTLHDFETARLIRASSVNSVLRNKQWAGFSDMEPGLAISYFKGLHKHVDIAGTIGGTFLKYPVPNQSTVGGNPRILVDYEAAFNLKMVSERHILIPYVIAGVGGQMYRKSFGAYVPLGLGLRFNVFDQTHLFITTQYRVPVSTETISYHFLNSIGFAGTIGKIKEKTLKPLPPPPPLDTDKDGIIDSLDKCPAVPGLAKYEGCPIPDTDKDGINDEEDKCPAVFGLARYQGCPIPDTDKDGVNDEEDKCITEAGPASNQGCPYVDTDGDGVPDPEDKCPTVPGPKENQGCPEIKKEVIERINYSAKNIYFATGKYTLLSKSFKGLDDVVKIMNENPATALTIDGHTDDVGADALNQKLSENRANAVKAYLVKKGVDETRLTATGYGETTPIADNKTPAGRQKNRRVELKLGY